MTQDKIIEVNASALRELLVALMGAPHCIQELQATRNPLLFPDNPINILLRQFNEKATEE